MASTCTWWASSRQPRRSSSGVTEGIGYTSALTLKLMDEAAESEIVRDQMDSPEVDVFTGKTFEELQDEENREFDMESVFTIDEDALRNAFSFDASALEGMGAGHGPLGHRPQRPWADGPMTNMLDPDAARSASARTMAADHGGRCRSSPDRGGHIAGAAGGRPARARGTAAGEARGLNRPAFMPWYLTGTGRRRLRRNHGCAGGGHDLTEALQAYMQQETVQQVIAELSESDVFQPDVSEDAPPVFEQMINQVMSYYLTKQFAPYMSKALGT